MKALILGTGLAFLPIAAVAQSACGLFEAVEPGDSFATIAERCDLPVEVLADANPEVDPARPGVGTVLNLDPSLMWGSTELTINDNPQEVARQAYLSEYVGDWSLSEACDSNAELWSLGAEKVQMGGEACLITGFDSPEGQVEVQLDCDGTEREFVFDLTDTGRLSAGEAMLARCTR